jgi:putative ABC transport system substrate-binding protein
MPLLSLGAGMRRRDFLTFLSGATAAWPLAARAQQPAMPMIGFLNPTMPETVADRLRQFHRGLKETGYVGGENVAIEYRWAEGENDRLPELAAELVRRPVSVIAAFAPPAVFAAKAATTAIPIVFIATEDPVRLGLVNSLARPGGNATGINIFTREVAAKRLELLRELLPAITRVAVLVNPADAENAENHDERSSSGRARYRFADPGSQRQQQSRDRCSFCDFNAREARRAVPRR